MKSLKDSNIFFFHDFESFQQEDNICFADSYVLFISEISKSFNDYKITSRVSAYSRDINSGIEMDNSKIFRLNYPNIFKLLRNPFCFYRIANDVFEASDKYDVLYLSWPHPISLFLAIKYRRNKSLAFVVRQNQSEIIKSKYLGIRRYVSILIFKCLDSIHRKFFKKSLIFTYSQEIDSVLFHKNYTNLVRIKDSLVNKSEMSLTIKTYTKIPKLLFVGRLEKEKGCEQLIKAFKIFQTHFPEAVLKIVGSGSQEDTLKNLCKFLNLELNITFTGFVPMGSELLQNYRDYNCLVVPSFSEGFPKVIDEARGFGMPIIAPDIGGLIDLEHITSGVYKVKNNHFENLAEAFINLFQSQELYNNLSENSVSSYRGDDLVYWSSLVTNHLNCLLNEQTRNYGYNAEL